MFLSIPIFKHCYKVSFFYCRTSSLLKVVKQFAYDTNKSCMFFGIPLLHFLFDKYVPYQAATPRVNHEDAKPEWWGTAEFDEQLKMFKGKSKWDR